MPEQQFGTVTIEAIDGGSLHEQLNEKLAGTAQKLADYVTALGVDMSKKAKAELTLKVTFQHVEAGIFTVKGDVAMKAPSAPGPSIDRLVLWDGSLMLATAPELNEKDDPRQRTFAHINPENPGEKAL